MAAIVLMISFMAVATTVSIYSKKALHMKLVVIGLFKSGSFKQHNERISILRFKSRQLVATKFETEHKEIEARKEQNEKD